MIIFSIKIHHNGETGQSQDFDFNMDKVLTFGNNLARASFRFLRFCEATFARLLNALCKAAATGISLKN